MATRKLIQFGKNSFVVSLPKDWVMRNKLVKGNEIRVEQSSDSILLSPNGISQNRELRIKKIAVDDTQRKLARNIISAYINNYSIIEIYGRGLKDRMKEIETTTQGMVALEIMEQTPRKVIIKDFLNTQDISIQNIISRMDIINRAMMSEVQATLEENGEEDIDLDKRDVDVNRLFYVGQKLINKVLDNPSLSKSLNIELKETMFYMKVLDSLEKIADQQKRMVRSIALLKKGCIAKKPMSTVYDIILKQYLKAIKALYSIDTDASDEVLSKKGEILNQCDEIIKKYCDNCPEPIKKHDHKIHESAQIVEKFKRLENYITQLAKAVINKD